MDRLLTAGLCGNTIGQDIQTLTYHSSTSNMAFHLKDVCSSNFTWPLNMMARPDSAEFDAFLGQQGRCLE